MTIERTQRIPEPLLSQLHAARLCRMLLPRSVDGDEVEPWVYLRAIEEISRHDGSVGWNMFVANSSALIAPFLPPEAMRDDLRRPSCRRRLGTTERVEGDRRARRLSRQRKWSFASGCRQATWMGAHCRVVEPDGSLRLNAAGRPTVRTLLCPVSQATLLDDTWNVIGMRGTMSGSYRLDDVFVPEAFSGTREDPRCDASQVGCTPIRCRVSMPSAWPASRWASPARCSMRSRNWRCGRHRAISHASLTTQWCNRTSRRWRRVSVPRMPILVETLSSIWSADDAWVIDVPARARVRLGCTFAIQTAEAMADHAYKAAGTDAIFLGTTFERRFRDIHTLSQQIQSRTAHFKSVGQIMLGIEPPGTFL